MALILIVYFTITTGKSSRVSSEVVLLVRAIVQAPEISRHFVVARPRNLRHVVFGNGLVAD